MYAIRFYPRLYHHLTITGNVINRDDRKPGLFRRMFQCVTFFT